MAMRATPGWLGITPLTRPSGERCLSQAGEFACPWASTEFPDSSEAATSAGHAGRGDGHASEQASPGAAG